MNSYSIERTYLERAEWGFTLLRKNRRTTFLQNRRNPVLNRDAAESTIQERIDGSNDAKEMLYSDSISEGTRTEVVALLNAVNVGILYDGQRAFPTLALPLMGFSFSASRFSLSRAPPRTLTLDDKVVLLLVRSESLRKYPFEAEILSVQVSSVTNKSAALLTVLKRQSCVVVASLSENPPIHMIVKEIVDLDIPQDLRSTPVTWRNGMFSLQGRSSYVSGSAFVLMNNLSIDEQVAMAVRAAARNVTYNQQGISKITLVRVPTGAVPETVVASPLLSPYLNVYAQFGIELSESEMTEISSHTPIEEGKLVFRGVCLSVVPPH